MTLEPKRLRSFILQICGGRLGKAASASSRKFVKAD
jgi:hypothetical protein